MAVILGQYFCEIWVSYGCDCEDNSVMSLVRVTFIRICVACFPLIDTGEQSP
jgi:hypothetical protein